MHPAITSDLPTRRRHAARLIRAVIDEEVSAGYALTRWPETPAEEQVDPSMQVAYQALWHFEGDEDRQKKELFYMDAQLELLNQLSRNLDRGRPLPPHLLNEYIASYSYKEHHASYFKADSLPGSLLNAFENGCRVFFTTACNAFSNLRRSLEG